MVPKVFKTGKRFGPIQATNMVLQCWRILVVAVPLLIFSLSEQFVVAKVLDEDTSPCTNAVTIIDDPLLTDQLALARKTFLATRPHPFDRLDSVILIPDYDGVWRRGGYNMNNVAYPASCVKLAYMVSAVKWCLENGKSYDCLDTHVRPMITVSSNFETGVIVDIITNATNIPINSTQDPRFASWIAKRRYTSDFLNSRGLLQNQVVLHKTYPSNSGYSPNGAEKLARTEYGMNMMNPKCAASLMLEIVEGKLFPEARSYMMQLLLHDTYSYTVYGPGLPPGSVIYTKTGNAYDTVEEIAYIVLPNKKSFILATFTNGYEPTEPFDTLSYFVDLVIQTTGLDKGLPVTVVLNATSRELSMQGSWTKGVAKDMYGNLYYYASSPDSNTVAKWTFTVPEPGMYTVSVWAPESQTQSTSVAHTVYHLDGKDVFYINQQQHGGRWTKLGDFNFDSSAPGIVTVSSGDGRTVAVNALKLAKWPDCNGVPGNPCD